MNRSRIQAATAIKWKDRVLCCGGITIIGPSWRPLKRDVSQRQSSYIRAALRLLTD